MVKPLYNIGYHTLKWVMAQFYDTYIIQKKLKRKLKKNMLQKKIIITHIKTRNKMGNNTDKQFLFPDFNDFY